MIVMTYLYNLYIGLMTFYLLQVMERSFCYIKRYLSYVYSKLSSR
jgi:hypothetical protein